MASPVREALQYENKGGTDQPVDLLREVGRHAFFSPPPSSHDHLEIDVMLWPTTEAWHRDVSWAIFRLHVQTYMVVALGPILPCHNETAQIVFPIKS